MFARIVAVLAIALVAAPAATAAKPSNLHGFLLKSNESVSPHVFARTPSFAWTSVPGATRYEFELSKSKTFADNAIVWSKSSIRAPYTTVPVTLPWTSGASYSWYARVRAYIGNRATGWSGRYGFDLQAPPAPTSLSSGVNPRPGMIRWTPVEGATGYEFTFIYQPSSGVTRTWTTATTAADLRELYQFHNQVATDGWTPVQWRVRAMRVVSGVTRNRIPAVSYGPSSSTFTTIEPDLDTASQITLGGTISRAKGSNVVSTSVIGPSAHELMPGFWWDGALSRDGYGTDPCTDVSDPVAATGATCPLFHVYVYSDEDCVNRVYTSDLVGSPAFVPRLDDPLDLPPSIDDLTDAATMILGNKAGDGEGLVYDVSDQLVYAQGTGPDATSNDSDSRESGLWDTDWQSGRWWWTVVPAVPYVNIDGDIEYRDVELPQDKCEAGDVQGFRKTSTAAIQKANGVPYVSGQTGNGTVRPATTRKPAFYTGVLVSWKPAPGAIEYEVQWSRTLKPWKTSVRKVTASTAAAFRLGKGRWYYRVRGLDPTIPGAKDGMTWSDSQVVRILPSTFVVS